MCNDLAKPHLRCYPCLAARSATWFSISALSQAPIQKLSTAPARPASAAHPPKTHSRCRTLVIRGSVFLALQGLLAAKEETAKRSRELRCVCVCSPSSVSGQFSELDLHCNVHVQRQSHTANSTFSTHLELAQRSLSSCQALARSSCNNQHAESKAPIEGSSTQASPASR